MSIYAPSHKSLAEFTADPNYPPVFNHPYTNANNKTVHRAWSDYENNALEITESELNLGDISDKEAAQMQCAPAHNPLRPSLRAPTP